MLSLNACALPARSDPESSNALSSHEAAETALGRQLAERIQAHPCFSGIYPLVDPTAAFAARGLLADAAERTLDIQYYIWQKDTTGLLLFNAVYSAAERGVRVRLLLDDFGVSGLDDELAALDIHPNIEVRLFNPFIIRNPKLIGFVTQFPQANRRMHNKSFTVDNQVTIIGGRNIGDEYFGAAQEMLFSDLDVIAVGTIVNNVSIDFDRYWVSDSVYPVSLILPSPERIHQQEIMEGITSASQRDGAYTYIEALRQSDVVRNMLDGTLPLEWAERRMISDDPAKGLGQAEQDALLVYQMSEILGNPRTNLELVSPYFVPTEAGTEAFVKLAKQGVNIRILTNSMEATDVAAVHAGYSKRRKDLLNAGIKLYEMRASSSESTREESSYGPFGSSDLSLHAKTFSVDNKRIFVGSFNFDPRSANLNTELGFIIDSPLLSRQMASLFDEKVPQEAYEVKLDDNNELIWLERNKSGVIKHHREPGTTAWQRGIVWFLSILPIEWML